MNAYASFSPQAMKAPLRTSKEIEYEAFARATSGLQKARASGVSKDMLHAIHFNTSLWNLLQADLSTRGNQLPDRLKADLVSLAIFSVTHGNKVSAGRADAQPLIDVNLSIMRGLRGEAG